MTTRDYLEFGWRFARPALLAFLAASGALCSRPAAAQNDHAACNNAFRQCASSCRLSGVMNPQAAQTCQAACSETRARCMRSGAPAGSGLAVTPGRAQVRAEPNAGPAAPAPATEVLAYEQPADLLYTGPVRFAPEYAQRAGPDDATPLAQEESWRPDRILRHDYQRASARHTEHEQGLVEELKKEYEAIAKAGFLSMSCSYGPTTDKKKYIGVTFWHGKRAALSEQMLNALRKYNGFDVAVARCPATYGEATALARGDKVAPDAQALLLADAAIKKRTGQRFLSWAARAENFNDLRPFYSMRIVVADKFTASFWRDSQAGTSHASSMPPAEWDQEWTRLANAGQKILYCGYAHQMSSGGLIVQGLGFWYERKPKAMSPKVAQHAEDANYPLVDIALASCPAYLGEAIAIAEGSPAALATAKQAQATALEAAKTLCDRLADQEGPASTIGKEPTESQMCKLVTHDIWGAEKAWNNRGAKAPAIAGNNNELGLFANRLSTSVDTIGGKIAASVTGFRKGACESAGEAKRLSCTYTISVTYQLSGPFAQQYAFLKAPLTMSGLSSAEFAGSNGSWSIIRPVRTARGGNGSFDDNTQRELSGFSSYMDGERSRLRDEERERQENRMRNERDAMDRKCGAFKICAGGW